MRTSLTPSRNAEARHHPVRVKRGVARSVTLPAMSMSMSKMLSVMTLVGAMGAGACASDPDPTDPYGTWELTYPTAPCGDGERVDQLKLLSDIGNGRRLWWPTTDDANRVNSDGFITDGTVDGEFGIAANARDGRPSLSLIITLAAPPSAEIGIIIDGCRVDAETAAIVKLEDE